MNSVPLEVVELIIINSDLESQFSMSMADSTMYSASKRKLKPVIRYRENGRIRSKTWVNGNVKRIVDYYDTPKNNKLSESWYIDNQLSREGKPANIEWFGNGSKATERWYRNGELHREESSGPAETQWIPNGNKVSEVWYKDGKISRVGGPSSTTWYEDGTKEYEQWTIDGKYHRIGGPSRTGWHENGVKHFEQWYTDGDKLHNE